MLSLLSCSVSSWVMLLCSDVDLIGVSLIERLLGVILTGFFLSLLIAESLQDVDFTGVISPRCFLLDLTLCP